MTPSRRFKDMVWVPEGTFLMGSADFYPEERPVHQVSVGGFWMDKHVITVAEYRRFVTATGYLTVAERAPDPAHYPGAAPEVLVPGSLVFTQPGGPVTSMTRVTGGLGSREHNGGIRRVRAAP